MYRILTFSFLAILMSCNNSNNIREQLEKDPTILTDTIRKHPELFMGTLQEIAGQMREKARLNRDQEEKEELEKALRNPIKITPTKDDLVIGNPNAKIFIYEYSDFQCPFCLKSLETVKILLEKYDGDIAFVYRHLPIDSIHPKARIASQYYEAVRIVAGEKAYDFHQVLLNNQRSLRHGEKYLDTIVKKMGLNVQKVAKIAKSKRVKDKIDADIASAQKYGFTGTPGFIVGGVPVKGAYPLKYFETIINTIKN